MKIWYFFLILLCLVCMTISCRKMEDGCSDAYCGSWASLVDTGYYSCGTIVENYIYTIWSKKEANLMTGEADAFNSGEPKKIKVCGWWFRPNDIIFLCDDNLSTLNPSSDISFPTESRKGWLKCDFSSSMDLIPNFNSETIHKKCFVSGEIRLDYPPEKKRCQHITPTLVITDLFYEE